MGTLIGKRVKITDSANPTLLGLTGKVVDETKKTITLMTKNGPKRLLRTAVTLEVTNE